MISIQKPDSTGVYRVGDLKFHSKLQAIEMHTRTGIHPHWDFNEDVFSSYDWKKEPTTSLPELYRMRAQQLRDQYDYIVLAFSGGADSWNVLRTFLDNDIKLDEVVSYINSSVDGNKYNLYSGEIFITAIPTVDEFKEKYPYLKHRVIDTAQVELDYFLEHQSRFDWIYEVNNMVTTNTACRVGFPLKIKDWSDMIDTGKKFCIIYGTDKPRIRHINGKFIFNFMDFVDNVTNVTTMSGQLPYADEFFYWSPGVPELVIKQAHIVKNYLSGDVTNLPWVSLEQSDLAYREFDNKKYWLNKHGLHQLIYPGWDISTFSNPKPSQVIFSLRSTWFFNMQDEHPAKVNWRIGLDKWWKLLPDYWKQDPQDMSKGVKMCWSKDYELN